MDDKPTKTHILDKLYEVIESRKGGDPETSYTAKLFEGGIGKMAGKIGGKVDIFKAVQLANAPMIEQFKQLSADVAGLKTDRQNRKQPAYADKLDDLFTKGHINAAKKVQLAAQGVEFAFSLTILDGWENVKMVNMANNGRSSASEKAPKIGDGKLSDDEVRGRLKKKGIDSALMPEIHHGT